VIVFAQGGNTYYPKPEKRTYNLLSPFAQQKLSLKVVHRSSFITESEYIPILITCPSVIFTVQC